MASWLTTTSRRWRRARHSNRANARVIFVGRAGFDKVKTVGRDKAPFEVRDQNGNGPDIARQTITASADQSRAS
jgi:hypothetical protein